MIIKCKDCGKKDRTFKFWHSPQGSRCGNCHVKSKEPWQENSTYYHPVPCHICDQYIHIDDWNHRFRCEMKQFLEEKGQKNK